MRDHLQSGRDRAASAHWRGTNDQPAVVILCPTAWSVRNMVHAGTVARLEEHGVRVHVLARGTPVAEGASGCQEHGSTELRDWTRGRPPRGKALSDELLRASFQRRYRLRSRRVFDRWRWRNQTPLERARYAAIQLAAEVGSHQPLFRWQRVLEERMIRRAQDVRAAEQQLGALAPALVVSTTCVNGIEWPYLLAARDLGIPTLGCILSFDNLTSRSVVPVFDHYAVWNQRMRGRVLQLYGDRDPKCITITGSPQFDFHHDDRFRWTRERTAAYLGVSRADRYVAYGANSARLTPSEPALVAALAREMDSDPVLQHHRLVVRLHPLDQFARWEALEHQLPRVRVLRPWKHEEGTTDPEDQARLVSTVLHADACVNIASTMSLDAAALDTPVVCVAFAVAGEPAERRFMQEVYETDHYAPIARSGGVRIARDMDALRSGLRDYVTRRDLDGDKRAALFRQEGGWCGAPAAGRLATLIGELVRDGCSDECRAPQRVEVGSPGQHGA